jgi:AraC-like DNA-binding protein
MLDLGQLDEIIAFHNREVMTTGNDLKIRGIFAAFILISGGLLWVIFRYRKRLKQMEAVILSPASAPAKRRLSREDIIAFINENLTTASIKTISHHFDTNHTMVYTVLAPDKPGDLIQQLRYDTVSQLRQEGRTPAEIAAATGLSESYVRRIRQKKDKDPSSPAHDEG